MPSRSSVIRRSGGSASRITVRPTITADKGPEGIRARRSHLDCALEGLEAIEPERLLEVGKAVERECTISNAIRGNVAISYEVVAA